MSDTIRGEVERRQFVEFEVDVATYVSFYPSERAEFEGSDEDFVRDGLREVAYDLLSQLPDSDDTVGDGVHVVDGDDSYEVSFY